MKNAYEQLAKHFRKVGDLGHVYSINAWGEAVMISEGGGAAQRADWPWRHWEWLFLKCNPAKRLSNGWMRP
ncbi:MAG: hypothetical protein ACI8Z1_003087 [Candidatus Azotimanducaceae bacterium]|jgi:hypothetical protein